MPDLEDASSVQLFVNEILRGLISGKFDQKQAKGALWGAMIASTNLRQLSSLKPRDVATKCDSCERGMNGWVRDLKISSGVNAGRTIGEILDADVSPPADE